MSCHAHLASQTQTRKSTQIMITEIDTLTSTLQLSTCSILNNTNFLFTNYPPCFGVDLLKDSCKNNDTHLVSELSISEYGLKLFCDRISLITGQFFCVCRQGYNWLLNRLRLFVKFFCKGDICFVFLNMSFITLLPRSYIPAAWHDAIGYYRHAK